MDHDDVKKRDGKKRKKKSRRSGSEDDDDVNAADQSKPAASNADAFAAVRSSSQVDDDRKPASSRGTQPAQPESLNRMEQDALAKSRASAAMRTGTVAGVRRISSTSPATMSSSATRTTVLNQLENDILIKNQARGGTATTATTARPVQTLPAERTNRTESVGAFDAVGGEKQGKGALENSGRDARASLRTMEQGIAAKTRAFTTSSTTGSAPSSTNDAIHSSRLQQMEDDVVAKTRARSIVSDQIQAPHRADSIQRASLSNMEDEIAAKRRAQQSSFASSTSSRGRTASKAASTSTSTSASMNIPSDDAPCKFTDGYDEEDGNQKPFGSETTRRPGHDNGLDGYANSTSASNRQPPQGQQPPEESGYPNQQSALVVEGQPADVGTNGIEAFVADPEVVDAYGVSVVLSEAEEERLERKRQRRYAFGGCIAFVALAALIVTTVVLTVGKSDPEDVPTTAPSDVPSMVPSFSPTTTRLDGWVESLESIVATKSLQNRTSPQYRAAVWVADEDELQLEVGSDRFVQRYALAVFYYALGGDNWEQCGRLDPLCSGDINDYSWLLGTTNECDWWGVDCDITNSIVTAIFFARQLGNNLIGYLPEQLLLLTDLKMLILQRNQLKGTIPTFLASLTKLEALFLLGNQFEGTIPTELLTGASLLGTIHLGENMLTGTIPTHLGRLPLRTLSLGFNGMVGPIPSEIGELSILTDLDLNDNALTGSIPSALFSAASLQRIALFNNSLDGSLTVEVGQLQVLEQLQLGDNSFTGSIPSELYRMASLHDFNFANNQITGQLSSSIQNLNSTLRKIHLENNLMTGPLPISAIESLGNLHELILHGNDFTGTISQAICTSRSVGGFFDLFNLTVSSRVDCSVERGCCNYIG